VLSNTFNLALAYRIAKQPERARTMLDQLVSRALKPKAESWMFAARALDVLGALAEDRHDSSAAIAARQRALDAIGHVDDPATRALILRQLGESERLAHHWDRALPLLEEALAYYERNAEDSYDLGIARYAVAMTLVDANRDRSRAVELLTKAAGDLSQAKSGESLDQLREQVAHALQRLAAR
jgi:tetratricopeptide (TPR) repeat protein